MASHPRLPSMPKNDTVSDGENDEQNEMGDKNPLIL
jgi:hypothetical protein